MVLAAGLSRRAGPVDKLVARVGGEPMVWYPVRAALVAGLSPVVVVTGGPGTGAHAAIEAFGPEGGDVLDAGPPGPSPIRLIVNPHPEQGLASSLRLGVSALGPETPAAIILLGDMPWVSPHTIRALVQAFRERPGGAAVPVEGGDRGNPVLWPAAYFPRLEGLDGDQGARSLLMDPMTPVYEVAVDDPGIHRDVDTPQELARLEEGD